ncbi:HNH endonuclease, partial [Providencia rettgeri]
MSLFNFSDEDKILIEDCIKKGHKGWYDESLKNLKGRLKEHLRKKQKNVCCYCSRNINGESKMIVDIEHILPKYKHKNHMFTLDNLAASCRRCNFQKGKKVDFLTSSFEKSESPFDTQNYHFIHPNADIYEDHIKYIHVQTGSDLIVFYVITPDSKKGCFSYDYFKLNDFVI